MSGQTLKENTTRTSGQGLLMLPCSPQHGSDTSDTDLQNVSHLQLAPLASSSPIPQALDDQSEFEESFDHNILAHTKSKAKEKSRRHVDDRVPSTRLNRSSTGSDTLTVVHATSNNNSARSSTRRGMSSRQNSNILQSESLNAMGMRVSDSVSHVGRTSESQQMLLPTRHNLGIFGDADKLKGRDASTYDNGDSVVSRISEAPSRNSCIGALTVPRTWGFQQYHLLLVLFVIYDLFNIPFRIAFWGDGFSIADHPDIAILFAIDSIIDLFFIFDIFLSFRKGFFELGTHLVMDPVLTKQHYRGSWFVFDVIVALPFEVLQLVLGRIIPLCRILKILRGVQLVRPTNEIPAIAQRRNERSQLEIVKLLLLVLFVIHVVACSKFGVVTFHDFGIDDHLIDASMSERFFFCAYWAMSTMFSLSNVVIPDLYLETFFALFCMGLGMLLFAYIIGTVSTVANESQISSQQKQVQASINRFLTQQGCPDVIVHRVHGYFEYVESTRNEEAIKEVLGYLPGGLKEEITFAMVKEHIDIELFEGFPVGFLAGLAERLNVTIVIPNEVLFTAGDEGNSMFFIGEGVLSVLLGRPTVDSNGWLTQSSEAKVEQGLVQSDSTRLTRIKTSNWTRLKTRMSKLLSRSSSALSKKKSLHSVELDFGIFVDPSAKGAKEVAKLRAGAHFGEYSLFGEGSKRTATVQSQGYGTLYELTREALFAVLSMFDPDVEETIRKRVVEERKHTRKKEKNIAKDKMSHMLGGADAHRAMGSIAKDNEWVERINTLLPWIALYNFFVIPFRISFLPHDANPALLVLDYFGDLIFIVHFVLQFFIEFTNKSGMIVSNLVEIRQRFVCSKQFPVFVVSIVPVDFFMIPYGIMPWLRLNKMTRIYDIYQASERVLKKSTNFEFTRLWILLCELFMLIHIVACLFWMFAEYGSFADTDNSEIEWAPGPSYETSATLHQYFKSWYFACILIARGRHPVPTQLEHIAFTIVVMFTGLFVISYLIGNVANVIANLDVYQSLFKAKLARTHNFARKYDLSKSFVTRMDRHLQNTWNVFKGLDANKVINHLPAMLQTDIKLHLGKKMILKVPYFENMELFFIRQIVQCLQFTEFASFEPIFLQGRIGHHMYFINSGAVQIRLDTPDLPPQTIKVITTGSFFGEGALFSKTVRSASAIAEVRTQCLTLASKDFEELIDKNEEFGRRMRIIATTRVSRVNHMRHSSNGHSVDPERKNNNDDEQEPQQNGDRKMEIGHSPDMGVIAHIQRSLSPRPADIKASSNTTGIPGAISEEVVPAVHVEVRSGSRAGTTMHSSQNETPLASSSTMSLHKDF